MTTIVSLFAGPGCGKSTVAAKLFALLKESNVESELVQEYVKTWAWEDRKPVDFDQFLLFGKQVRRETLCLGKVDVVVTDSPVAIASYYTEVYGSPLQGATFKKMHAVYRAMLRDKGHKALDIWLKRCNPYQSKGRFQTEDEAKAIDTDMLRYLTELGLAPTEVEADERAAETIRRML